MKPPSIATLDKWFSIFIRKRDTVELSTGVRVADCFTCGRSKTFRELDCSHYIGRQYYAVRWAPKNARAACQFCNRFNEGEKGIFRVRLVEIYGEEEISRLEAGKREGRKPKPYEAVEILKRIKADIAGLAKTA